MEFKENGALAAFSLPLAAKDILPLLSPYLKEEDTAAIAVCHMIDEWIDNMCIHELCFVFLCGWFIEDVACPQGCPFFFLKKPQFNSSFFTKVLSTSASYYLPLDCLRGHCWFVLQKCHPLTPPSD